MRYVAKGPAPACLTTLHATPGADWGSVSREQRAEIGAALVRDQRGLCAYCERRIFAGEEGAGDPVQIEHWAARSAGHDPFDWGNLLGVCCGNQPERGERRPRSEQHCDRHRGDASLTLHPGRQVPDLASVVRFLGDGRVEAPPYDADIATLNLKHPRLVANRKRIVDILLRDTKGASLTALRAELERWQRVHPEHVSVAILLLGRAIRGREAKGDRLKHER